MKEFQKIFIGVLLSLVALPLSGASVFDGEINEMLQRLDAIVAHRNFYRAQKDQRISQLKQQARASRDQEEVYWINKNLYEEYKVYDADSAMYYVKLNSVIARQMGKPERVAEWNIKKSFLLTATGLLKEALDAVKDIEVAKLPRELKVEYYDQMIYLYSHMNQYTGSQTGIYTREVLENLEQVCRVMVPQDPSYYYNYGWKYSRTPQARQAIERLKGVINEREMNNRADAMNAYRISDMYHILGDERLRLKYLILSAYADVKTSNKDVASLEEIAQIMYEHGELDRAYDYINYCLQIAEEFKSRVRVVGVATIQSQISKAYQIRNSRQEAKISDYLVAVSVLTVVLLIAILFIYLQMRRLSASRSKEQRANRLLNEQVEELSKAHEQLEETNNRLADLSAQLKESNGKLAESNFVKEKYIGNIFAICSAYISKLDDFRREINRKIKTKQFDEARQQTETPVMAQNELKELYNNFDVIFLHIYPDFVEDFNALLRPEEQIELKKGELLNTELRIYALVRLGISDSVQIAKFLHCSPQTVYNNRQRIRNKAVIPKDKFAEVVKTLGKISF